MTPKLDEPLSVTTGKPYEILDLPLSDDETQTGEIYNSLKCKIEKKPPQSISNSKLEQQKKVILDKFREYRLNEIR